MTTTPQLLSDDDIHDVCEGVDYTYSPMKFAYAIEAKILAKLQASPQAQPAADADTSNTSLKVTRTLIAANKANAILRLALKELRAALDPDDWMGELPMQTFVDHILKQADAAYDEASDALNAALTTQHAQTPKEQT